MADIYEFLASHGIPYQRFDHEAVFTTAESSKLPTFPGADTKNLFLREDRGTRHFLVTVPHDKRVDLKALGVLLGVKRLAFGEEEDLKNYLGVTPGSVTLLGAMHDTEHHVEIWIDQQVWDDEAIQCHPLINTATLVIPHVGMEAFFKATGHNVHVLTVPNR